MLQDKGDVVDKRNELKNPGAVDLILRKTAGNSLFDEIVVGDIATLNQFKEKSEDIVLSKLFEDAVGDIPKIGKLALTDVHNSLKYPPNADN